MRNSKSIKRKRNIFFIFSIIFSYLPIIIFLIIGFCTAQPVQKLQLTATCIAAIVLYGITKKVPVFQSFIAGAKEGVSSAFSLLPTLIGITACIRMFEASGGLDLLAQLLSDPAKLLTFDQHLLLAAIAPRAVLVEGFDASPWMDCKGEFLACRAAAPVWAFLGKGTMPDVAYPDNFDTSAIGASLGFVRRSEDHGISACDWQWMLDFAVRNLK